MKIGDQPAFPCEEMMNGGLGDYLVYYDGMTYRQWLIGMTLNGVLSNPELREKCRKDAKDYKGTSEEYVARAIISMADAILTALEKE
jgi:hypothetical protein